MNFILTIIICSATVGECIPPYKWPNQFIDAYSCMLAGNEESISKLVEIGNEEVNRHKIYIKFQCTEVIKGEAT